MGLPKLFRHTFFPGGIRISHVLFYSFVVIIAAVLIFNRIREERSKEVIKTSQENKAAPMTPKLSEGAPSDGNENAAVSKITSGGERLLREETIHQDASAADKTPKLENEQKNWFPSTLTEEERSEAISELAKKDYPTIVSVVTKSLDAPDPDVREEVLDALMGVDDDQVNTPLLKALEDENPDVIEKAMDVMDNIHSSNILPSLERALGNKDEDVREQAINIIEDIPDPRAIDILIEKGLYNDYPSTREDALDSLNFITDQDFDTSEEARQWWQMNKNSFVFQE